MPLSHPVPANHWKHTVSISIDFPGFVLFSSTAATVRDRVLSCMDLCFEPSIGIMFYIIILQEKHAIYAHPSPRLYVHPSRKEKTWGLHSTREYIFLLHYTRKARTKLSPQDQNQVTEELHFRALVSAFGHSYLTQKVHLLPALAHHASPILWQELTAGCRVVSGS